MVNKVDMKVEGIYIEKEICIGGGGEEGWEREKDFREWVWLKYMIFLKLKEIIFMKFVRICNWICVNKS